MADEARDPKIREAVRRLLELDAEAVRTRASCKIVVEVTYQQGKAQHVQDERRRYALPESGSGNPCSGKP